MPTLIQILYECHSGDRMSYPAPCLALLGDDWIPLTLPEQMRGQPNEMIDIISLGRATECAIWSVYYPIGKVESTWTSIPYGRGLHNQSVYTLNVQLEECPVGVEGGIYIGGIRLAQGYLNDVEKMAASFIWCEASGERTYRTGDRGCYFTDRQVAFLGRNDTQVKANGYRIELGEIKSHPGQLDSVGSVAVVCHQGQLYVLITTAENLHPDDTDALLAYVRAQLAVQLSYYLLPQYFFPLKVLPMAGNGKIDWAAVVQEVIQCMPQPTSQKSRTLTRASPYEQQVVALWCEVLQREQIGLDDNFSETGDGSVQIMLLYHRIEKIFKVTVSTAELLRLATAKKITDYLQAIWNNAWTMNRARQRDAPRSRARQQLVRRHQCQR